MACFVFPACEAIPTDAGNSLLPSEIPKRVTVPCDDCIKSFQVGGDGGNVRLCQQCINILHRPRKDRQRGFDRRKSKYRREPSDISTVSSQLRAPSIRWDESQNIEHAIRFFIKQSAPELAGCFDASFWQQKVLQAGIQESAIKYILAAIGALHERLLTGALERINPLRDKRLQFAIELYNRSIRCLIQPEQHDNSLDIRLILTTCLLFTCFESLQGNCEQASVHACKGYRVLQYHSANGYLEAKGTQAFAVELHQLNMLVERIKRQSRYLVCGDYETPSPLQHLASCELPIRFSTIHDAQSTLETILNGLESFIYSAQCEKVSRNLDASTAEKHSIFKPRLHTWEDAFSRFNHTASATRSTEEKKAILLLNMHYTVAQILSDIDLSLGELGWDKFQDEFNMIVQLAIAILDGETQSDISVIDARWKTNGVFISSTLATLSFSLGIVDPLYLVCIRCRDPSLRRKALDLLASYPRQEGMWSSWSAWKSGQVLMRIEEGSSGVAPTKASDISVEHRISDSWFDFSIKSRRRPYRGRVAYKSRSNAVNFVHNPDLLVD